MIPWPSRSRHVSSNDQEWRFVVSPPGETEPIRFGMSVVKFRILAVAALLVLALMITGIAIYSRLLREASRTKDLAAEVLRLREDNEKIVVLAADLDEIRAREQQVRELLGIADDETTGRSAAAADSAEAPHALVGAPAPDGRFPRLWPLRGELSRAFAPGPGHRHEGVDIASRTGTPVQAAGGGTVAYAGPDSIFGNVVKIDHGTGYTTLYGHNSRLAVK